MGPADDKELQRPLSWHPRRVPGVLPCGPSGFGWVCLSSVNTLATLAPLQTRAAPRGRASELRPPFDWVSPEGESKQQLKFE